MHVGIIAVIILFGFGAIASILLWPFRTIWAAAWEYPERTAKTVIAIVTASMLVTWFELPWKFGVKLAGGHVSGWALLEFFALAIAYSGPLVGNILFLVFWFAIPYTAFVFLKTALSFSKAHPEFFVSRMLIGFSGAFLAYTFTGYVPITWALYGIGALIIFSCLKALR